MRFLVRRTARRQTAGSRISASKPGDKHAEDEIHNVFNDHNATSNHAPAMAF